MYTAHVHFFTNLDLFCIDNARVIYRKIRYLLTVFENMVLRMTLGPKRDEVTGEWRRLQNEELIELYSSPNTIRLIFYICSIPL